MKLRKFVTNRVISRLVNELLLLDCFVMENRFADSCIRVPTDQLMKADVFAIISDKGMRSSANLCHANGSARLQIFWAIVVNRGPSF